MTKDRAWRERMRAQGRCIWCGEKREASPFKSLCSACGVKARKRQRYRMGSKLWKKGSAGRPPKKVLVITK